MSRPRKIESPAAARKAKVPRSGAMLPQTELDRVIRDQRKGYDRCEHPRGWMSFPSYRFAKPPMRVRRVSRPGTESFGQGEQPKVTKYTGTLIKKVSGGGGGSKYAVVEWDDFGLNLPAEKRRGEVVAPEWNLMREPIREEEE